MNNDEASQLRELAARLLGLTEAQGGSLMFDNPVDDAPLIDLIQSKHARYSDHRLSCAADSELERRKLRKKFLPADWFSEGAWNILMDLFASEYRGREVSVTSACIASDVPSSTALRHIAQLVDNGFLHRIPDPSDNRRIFLRLTPTGMQTLRLVLTGIVDCERGELTNRGKAK